jgi:hypothetical protein
MKYEILENVIDSLESIGEGADSKIKEALDSLYTLRDEILAERMYERSLNAEDIVSKYAYGKGGRTKFKDKVQSISSRLEGTKVPAKYRREYGSTYDKQESEIAGRRIAGAMMKKYAFGGALSYFIVVFQYNDDGEMITQKSKPILAKDENEAAMKLKEQFENFEGTTCHIIIVKKV